jgi:hypothetical protein
VAPESDRGGEGEGEEGLGGVRWVGVFARIVNCAAPGACDGVLGAGEMFGVRGMEWDGRGWRGTATQLWGTRWQLCLRSMVRDGPMEATEDRCTTGWSVYFGIETYLIVLSRLELSRVLS